MLLHPRAVLIAGILAIGVLGALLFVSSPMPAGLASPHARISGLGSLATCDECHRESGVTEGCLSCHVEIAAQLEDRTGYHHYLFGSDATRSCGDCHPEHNGNDFALVSDFSWRGQVRAAFRHPHVKFELHGAHEDLSCVKCHRDQRLATVTLPAFPQVARAETYLGITQDCASCHADIHSGGLTPTCSKCHGQDVFDPPAHFDHGKHLALAGGHADLACQSCHTLPDPTTPREPFPFPFSNARGSACEECHRTPHRVAFAETCDRCHAGSDPLWTNAAAAMTPELHARTKFPLASPHDGVACAGCHAPDLPFDARHPDPAQPDYRRREDTCDGCHRDVHEGQFAARHSGCLDCHYRNKFRPPSFDQTAHAELFPLTGSHAAVACSSCHGFAEGKEVRQFAGTPHGCKTCHDNPHGDQFAQELEAGDCTTCHDAHSTTFTIRPFDHEARTGFALVGAHTRAECHGCHRERPMQAFGGATRNIRIFRGTSQECDSCHKDVHRGQFDQYGSCVDCHISPWTWRETRFDHDTQTRFPLEGAHKKVPCSGCHKDVTLEDGSTMIHYKPLGRECRDCHELPAIPTGNR